MNSMNINSSPIGLFRKDITDPKQLAATTIATILGRLEKDGFVSYKKMGRKFIYSAKVGKHEITKTSISSLIQNFFKGNKLALVNHLLADEGLSSDELEQIQNIIREREISYEIENKS